MTTISNNINFDRSFATHNDSLNKKFSAPVVQNPWPGRALKAAKVVGGVLLFAAASSATGSLLNLAGTSLVTKVGMNSTLLGVAARNLGGGMQVAGNAALLAGRYAFLSISVPVYTVGWVVPKWVVTTAIPKMAALASVYVLTPMLKGAEWVATHLAVTARAIYNQVLVPLANLGAQFFKWAHKYVLIPLVDGLVKVATAMKEIVVTTAQAIYNHALKPLLKVAVKAIKQLHHYVFVPLFNQLSKLASLVRKAVIVTAKAVYNHALVPLTRMTVRAFEAIKSHVLLPLLNRVVKAADLVKEATLATVQAIYKHLFVPLANLTVRTFEAARKTVVVVAQATYRHILAPLGKMTFHALEKVHHYIVMPLVNGIVKVGGYMKKATVVTAQAIYNYALKPIAQAVVHASKAVGHAGQLVIKEMQVGFNAVVQTYNWIASKL